MRRISEHYVRCKTVCLIKSGTILKILGIPETIHNEHECIFKSESRF